MCGAIYFIRVSETVLQPVYTRAIYRPAAAVAHL